MYKHKLIDFVVQFMEEIDSEVPLARVRVRARVRVSRRPVHGGDRLGGPPG
jgi:hypothetical protein